MEAIVYCVRVRRNLVEAIDQVSRSDAPDAAVFDDRLAVSTELAQNNLVNGCFDGDYFLEDFEMARNFAALCIGFMKNLCENSLDAINEAYPVSGSDWRNPHIPKRARPD